MTPQEGATGAPAITVVVCTHERAGLLPVVLDSLLGQTLDPAAFEVLIVDNASTDDTGAVAARYVGAHRHVRTVREERPGLSLARNRGWREARGRYVGYIDDDGRAPPDWLAVATRVIRERSPGAFGGPYYPYYQGEPPGWWKDEYRAVEHAERARPLEPREHLSGGNMFFRRSLLEALGGFDPRLGMRPGAVATAEEVDLLHRLRRRWPDEEVYYTPELYIHHLVHPERMELDWLVRYWFASGRYNRLYRGPTALPDRILAAPRMVAESARLAAGLVAGLLARDRERYPDVRNHLVEVSARRVARLGRLYQELTARDGGA